MIMRRLRQRKSQMIGDRMVKFICDRMLGRLARWLRMMGYDTKYDKGGEGDADLLKRTEKSGRILLTRDTEIAKRKSGATVLLVKSDQLDEQIKQVISEHNLAPEPERILTLCSACGGKLKRIEKGDVFGKVPDGVFARNEEFWQCPDCGKVYWKGSHYKKILEKIEKFRAIA